MSKYRKVPGSRVIIFENENALWVDEIETDDRGNLRAYVINGGWWMWLEHSTMKACRSKTVFKETDKNWGGYYTERKILWDTPVSVVPQSQIVRTISVPEKMYKRLEDTRDGYNDVIEWALTEATSDLFEGMCI